MATVELAVQVQSKRWHGTDVETLAHAAAESTLKAVGDPATTYQISLLACDDDDIAKLNCKFRTRQEATDILSWPHAEPPTAGKASIDDAGSARRFLGDLAISWTCCSRDADRMGQSFGDHVKRLVVHGVLHLLGHDHADGNSAKRMHEIEAMVLDSLGIDHPYTSRPGADAQTLDRKGQ